MKLNERYTTFDICKAIDNACPTYRGVFAQMEQEGVHKKFFKVFESGGLICEDPNATVIFTRKVDGARFEGEVKLSALYDGKTSPCWVEQVTYTAYADRNYTQFSVCNQSGKKIFSIKHEKSA